MILKRMALLFNRFSPLEKALLKAVEGELSQQAAGLYRSQVAAVNQVQRVLEWEEIDFYCLRFRRLVRWNHKILFPNHSEFVLARIAYNADGKALETLLWAVGGHIFSLETEGGLRKHAFPRKIEVKEVTISGEIMEEKERGPTTRGILDQE